MKCFVLVVSCLALVAASTIDLGDSLALPEGMWDVNEPALERQVRSPQKGSVDLRYQQDQRGREASMQYNHNIYTSKDGRGSIDAYAQGSRNFDHNRNSYGGGITGRWRF